MLVNVVAVIPHHHHHHRICLAEHIEHQDADSEQEEMEHTCITHFRAQIQAFQHLNDIPLHTTSIRDLLHRIGWCVCFQTCFICAEEQAYFIPSSIPLGPPPYLEKRSGRAPPVVC